jgi:hypothetical protein
MNAETIITNVAIRIMRDGVRDGARAKKLVTGTRPAKLEEICCLVK